MAGGADDGDEVRGPLSIEGDGCGFVRILLFIFRIFARSLQPEGRYVRLSSGRGITGLLTAASFAVVAINAYLATLGNQ